MIIHIASHTITMNDHCAYDNNGQIITQKKMIIYDYKDEEYYDNDYYILI